MIAIVDYGMGNLKSVTNVFRRLGADVAITREKEVIGSARAVVLPGVGAFGKCIENLEKLNLLAFLRNTIRGGTPYLGICLGMQVLFEKSEEAPGIEGLGIIKGSVPKFRGRIKVPHMGWNSIEIMKETPILKGIETGEHFYFVHSYYCLPEEDVTATKTYYGGEFASSVLKGNIFACQFHPEKSQRIGQVLLKNFISLHT
jgi:glutamine amidotransferase